MCIVSAVDLSQCSNFTYAVFCCRIQSDDGAIVLKKKFVIKQRTQYVRSSFCPLMSFRQGACVGEKIISCICLVYSTTCKVTAPCLTCPWQAVHTCTLSLKLKWHPEWHIVYEKLTPATTLALYCSVRQWGLDGVFLQRRAWLEAVRQQAAGSRRAGARRLLQLRREHARLVRLVRHCHRVEAREKVVIVSCSLL